MAREVPHWRLFLDTGVIIAGCTQPWGAAKAVLILATQRERFTVPTMPTPPANDRCPDGALARYRPWFYAAALYNLVWGSASVLAPQLFFRLIGMPAPNYLPFWQVVGMFVLVFAPGYWWAARHPARHRHLIAIGLLGKVLGPFGFAWAVATGQLPLAFGWTILTNDLIWWPAFALYLRDAARHCGGWAALLRGA